MANALVEQSFLKNPNIKVIDNSNDAICKVLDNFLSKVKLNMNYIKKPLTITKV